MLDPETLTERPWQDFDHLHQTDGCCNRVRRLAREAAEGEWFSLWSCGCCSANADGDHRPTGLVYNFLLRDSYDEGEYFPAAANGANGRPDRADQRVFVADDPLYRRLGNAKGRIVNRRTHRCKDFSRKPNFQTVERVHHRRAYRWLHFPMGSCIPLKPHGFFDRGGEAARHCRQHGAVANVGRRFPGSIECVRTCPLSFLNLEKGPDRETFDSY